MFAPTAFGLASSASPKLPKEGGGFAILTLALPQQPMTLTKQSSASTVPAGRRSARFSWSPASSVTSGSILSSPESLMRIATLCGESAPSATDGPLMATTRARTSSPFAVFVNVASSGLKTADAFSVTVCENVRAIWFTELAGTPLMVTVAWPGGSVV
jgi:hypothetical protein